MILVEYLGVMRFFIRDKAGLFFIRDQNSFGVKKDMSSPPKVRGSIRKKVVHLYRSQRYTAHIVGQQNKYSWRVNDNIIDRRLSTHITRLILR